MPPAYLQQQQYPRFFPPLNCFELVEKNSLHSHGLSLFHSLVNPLIQSHTLLILLQTSLLLFKLAWTQRSRGEAAKKPNRKSWKQKTDMHMRPFLLNVFFSKRFVHAKVMHGGTSKVISVATTNSKDLRNTLPSLTDTNACRAIGKLIAEQSKEAAVFAMSYEAKKNERIEGRLGIVLDTIKENGIIFFSSFYPRLSQNYTGNCLTIP